MLANGPVALTGPFAFATLFAMRFRFAQPGDGAGIAAIYGPIVAHTAISFEVEPPDAALMRARIAEQPANRPWIVAERDAQILGYAYASPFRGRAAYRWSAETTVYVAESARRRGVAGDLYAVLFGLLVAQGYRRAFAGITLPNHASERLHRAIGFTDVGVFRAAGHKFGAWHDVMMLQRALAPLTIPEHDPLPVAELAAAQRAAIFALRREAREDRAE